MSHRVSLVLREQLIDKHLSGQSLKDVARELVIPYSTARRIWSRFKHRGRQGLKPDYANCGQRSVKADSYYSFRRASCLLKRRHPKWGAPFIRVLIQERFPIWSVPAVRTIQTWFNQAGLQPRRSVIEMGEIKQLEEVHDEWQIDAKECLELQNGQKSCYLSIVDVKSGAGLALLDFPPVQDLPSAH